MEKPGLTPETAAGAQIGAACEPHPAARESAGSAAPCFTMELSAGNWMRAEPNPSRGAGAWRMEFSSAEAAQSVIRARFHFLRDIRSPNAETRAQTLAKMRELPFIMDGMHSDWVDFNQEIEREEGLSAPEALPEDRALVAKMHAEASLGPWMNTDDEATVRAKRLRREAKDAAAVAAGDDPEPVRVQRGESGSWIFTPNGHWLIDAAIFGDMGSLGAVLEAGADPSLVREQPRTAQRKESDAQRAANGLDPLPLSILGVWNYCMSVLEADPESWLTMGIGMEGDERPDWSEEEIRSHMANGKKHAMGVLSLCLSFGLEPRDPHIEWHLGRGWRWDGPSRGLKGDLHKQMRVAIEAFAMRESIRAGLAANGAADSSPASFAEVAGDPTAKIPGVRRV